MHMRNEWKHDKPSKKWGWRHESKQWRNEKGHGWGHEEKCSKR